MRRCASSSTRAHAAGIKVIQDQVANHSGPYHPWVSDAPTPTWYYGTQAKHLANTWQTWTLQDAHATAEVQKATLEGWFIDILPDLNQDDPETARYEIQNTLWWIGVTGLDGVRQDTLPYVHRRFWRDWMAAIKKEYPRVTVVGELLDGDPALVSFYQGGEARFDGIDSGVDTLFDFPLYYTIREAFGRGGSLRDVARMLARDHLYRDPSVLVTLPRPARRAALHERAGRFAGVAAQSRSRSCSPRAARRSSTTATRSRWPGGGDPDNRRDFPGGFPGDARSAFEAAGRTPDEEAVHARVRALAAAARRDAGAATRRHAQPARRRQVVGLRPYTRGRRPALVAFNTGDRPEPVDVDAVAAGLPAGSRLTDRARLGARGDRRRRPAPPDACPRARRRFCCRSSNDPLDSSAIIHEPS